MKLPVALALAAALAAAATRPTPRQFRFRRAVQIAPAPVPRPGSAAGTAAPACAVLSADVYQHAAVSLDDVRLFQASPSGQPGPGQPGSGQLGSGLPYAITVSNPSYLPLTDEQASILNLGLRGTHIVFDLAMPPRPYSAVTLALNGENFLATAKVTGRTLPIGSGTDLGTYILFDLTGQGLGRKTTLALPEATFPYLHVDLEVDPVKSANRATQPAFSPSAAMVTGVTVPPSRAAQTLYTEVARTSTVVQRDRTSVATFDVPAHVPVERVRFELAPADSTNFSREVTVTAHPRDAPASEQERLSGQIARLRLSRNGHEVRQQVLALAATLGANARQPAQVTVTVDNGDDRPLALAGVVLEMRQRKLCFDVPPRLVTMFYGDQDLAAPRYDFSRTFAPGGQTRQANLGPEQRNPEYLAPVAGDGLAASLERHQGLVWIALLAVLALLGAIAYRSGRQIDRHQG